MLRKNCIGKSNLKRFDVLQITQNSPIPFNFYQIIYTECGKTSSLVSAWQLTVFYNRKMVGNVGYNGNFMLRSISVINMSRTNQQLEFAVETYFREHECVVAAQRAFRTLFKMIPRQAIPDRKLII